MTDQERDGQGRFQQEYTVQDVIDAVRKHEPAGTQEVADELGIVRQSADYRLRQLEQDGRVVSKKVGGTLAWMLSEED